MATDPIAAARALLPWWIPWANLLVAIPAAALVAGISTWIAAAIATRPLRKAMRVGALAEEERVRLQYPLRRSIGPTRIAAVCLLPAAVALLGDELAYLPRLVVVAVTAAIAFLVSARVSRRFRPAEAHRKTTRAQRLRLVGFVAIWLCRLPLVVAMILLIGPELDARSWIVAALAFALFVSFWFGSTTWLMRVTRIVTPASARLVAAARVAAERCGTRAPTTLELDLPIANALALPSSYAIVATSGALALLDDAELAAMCTHEVAHLTEGRWMGAGRHVGDVALLALGMSQILAGAIGFWPTVALDVGAALVAASVAKLVAAHGERRADAIAHRTDPAPEVYLRALEKLHREGGIPLALSHHARGRRGLLHRLFGPGGSHGSFSDRAVALGAAAPAGVKPPSRGRAVAARFAGTFSVAFGVALIVMISFISSAWITDLPLPGPRVRLAFSSDVGHELAELAAEWKEEGRSDDALTLLAARAEIEADTPAAADAQLDLANGLAEAGRTEEAKAALARANERIRDAKLGAPDRHGELATIEQEALARLERVAREIASKILPRR